MDEESNYYKILIVIFISIMLASGDPSLTDSLRAWAQKESGSVPSVQPLDERGE